MNAQREPSIALFVGSFDPFTIGHWDVVDRALSLFDRLIIGIGVHPSKKCLLSAEERLYQIRTLYQDNPRVEVCAYSGLTIDLAKEYGARHIVRGLRSSLDFEYEKNIATINQRLGGIETIYLQTLVEMQHISSSMLRELLSHGVDISPYIPEGMPWSDTWKVPLSEK